MIPVRGRYLILLKKTAIGRKAGNGDKYTMINEIMIEISAAFRQSPKELAICTTRPSLNKDCNPSQTCDGVGNKCFVPSDIRIQ